ncbi:hypothetical protein SAMN05444483_101591 [Salegentibacter echinorum]|uniref:Uncharacterized protein n=1 Tax=Salegentibacter echinorum TaxID=1073325 RepID=A0A1M5CNI9_SALEC|nr:hypothetical protein SAMN05444483_101591 [Salegentibacter echinorum]
MHLTYVFLKCDFGYLKGLPDLVGICLFLNLQGFLNLAGAFDSSIKRKLQALA